MPVNLAKLPSAPKEYQVTLDSLYGGLNTSRLPHEIGRNQLSECRNVWWKDGAVRSRNGQHALRNSGPNVWRLSDLDPRLGASEDIVPLTMYDKSWNGCIFMAFMNTSGTIGAVAYYNTTTHSYRSLFSTQQDDQESADTLWSKKSPGCFFEFNEKLYYKNKACYIEISYSNTSGFTYRYVSPYRPVIQINTKPNGLGDFYQPENRLSPYKEVWYNLDQAIKYVEMECDGNERFFRLPYKVPDPIRGTQDGDLLSVLEVYVGARLCEEGTDYYVESGDIVMITAPAIGLKLTAKVQLYCFSYRLPTTFASVYSVYIKSLSTGTYVQAREVQQSPIWDASRDLYEYIESSDCIIFSSATCIAPPEYDANVLNSFIKVVYYKENRDAMDSIRNSNIATVFGSSGIETNCVVLAGTPAQPNAIFWSGNDENGANPTYFPMDQYNIVGDSSDPIVAFGRQQDRLVIFQGHRVSAATFGLTDVNGRLTISMNVKAINDRIGCDMPKSVQLCNNNLVWAHSRYGVLYLKDSTYAYETLIECISDNVNDGSKVSYHRGLLRNLYDNKEDVSSMDDGERYWLSVGNYTYLWDYKTQPYTSNKQKLCWWLFDNIDVAAWAIDANKIYGLSKTNIPSSTQDASECWLFDFDSGFTDFGKPVHRCIQPQTQIFGTYDRLKNVNKMIVSVDNTHEVMSRILYITDYETRDDWTMINSDYHDSNLIYVRKPKCLHVHRFAVRFYTYASDRDFNLISCQLFFSYRGRTKAGLRI